MSVGYIADNRLSCAECGMDGENNLVCDHVLKYMRENHDAPLLPGDHWVPTFKSIKMPTGVEFYWEVQVAVPAPDANGIAPVCYLTGGTSSVLCLIGPHDGRYAIRTAILQDLHAIERDGQLPCSGRFHDGRYDHLYAQRDHARARLVDSYYRKYLGVCQPCHAMGPNPPGGLGDL